MTDWWINLTRLNQAFYAAAALLSVLFLWRFAGGLCPCCRRKQRDAAEAAADPDAAPAAQDDDSAYDSAAVGFRAFTSRSVLAMALVFFWAGAAYMDAGFARGLSLICAAAWAVGTSAAVLGIAYLLGRAERQSATGLKSCIGCVGDVVREIPPGAAGEVRITVGGVVSHVAATAVSGQGVAAGAAVSVVRLTGSNAVEVAPVK